MPFKSVGRYATTSVWRIAGFISFGRSLNKWNIVSPQHWGIRLQWRIHKLWKWEVAKGSVSAPSYFIAS